MNINTPLLDSMGRDLYSIGGHTAYKTATYKGYCVSLEWFVGNRTTEPMLCIWPVAGGRDAGVWGICLSSAGKFADPDGRPTAAAFEEARETLVECFDRAPLASSREVSNKAISVFFGIFQLSVVEGFGLGEARLQCRQRPLLLGQRHRTCLCDGLKLGSMPGAHLGKLSSKTPAVDQPATDDRKPDGEEQRPAAHAGSDHVAFRAADSALSARSNRALRSFSPFSPPLIIRVQARTSPSSAGRLRPR